MTTDTPTPSKSRRFARIVLRILCIPCLAWLGLVVLAAIFYPRLLYHPDVQETEMTPENSGAAHEPFWLTAADGVRLHGWFVPADPSVPKNKTLVAFHGNAGNLGTAAIRLAMYSRLGCDVYMVDYHGFGRSGGSPSEAALYLDADALWQYVTAERGVRPADIVILGYSLGGAVAAYLAEKHCDAAGLVLESTFTALADVAADLFPWLPCRLILGDAFATIDRLPHIPIPIMVIHGEGDELVSFRFGRALYEKVQGEKTFLRIASDHNVGFLYSEDIYMKGVNAFLRSLRLPADVTTR